MFIEFLKAFSQSHLRGKEISIGRISGPRVCVGGSSPVRLVAPFGLSTKQDIKIDLVGHVQAMVDAGADMVQELSIFGPYAKIRSELISSAKVPFGTVLAYELADRCLNDRRLTPARVYTHLQYVLDSQISQGIAYTTVHAALSKSLLTATSVTRQARSIPIGSRAAGMLIQIMRTAMMDNPLSVHFDEIVAKLTKEKVAISLGSSFRPVAISDAMDHPHKSEIEEQGHLVKISLSRGGTVLLEGLSHATPIDLLEYVKFAREVCKGAAVTALGPLPTDVAAGCDHIAASIGLLFGVLAGLDLVNIVTAKEHLSMPSKVDAVDAIRAARVAIYVAKIIKQGKNHHPDRSLSSARGDLDWRGQAIHALFPELVTEAIHLEDLHQKRGCRICGDACPLRTDINVRSLCD